MQIPTIWKIIFGVHISIIAVYFLIIKGSVRSALRKEMAIPVVLIPFFGIVFALIVEYLHHSNRGGKKPIDMERLTLGPDIYWKPIDKLNENKDLVPLEEAIIINDYQTRRRLLLDTLFENPKKHIDILILAKNNSDVETAHYATTNIARIQRDYQLEIQRYESILQKNPEELETINAYIEALGSYIDSGLIEEYLLKRQRIIFSELLNRKLALVPLDKETLIKKLRNSLDLLEYFPALETSRTLRENWPNDETSWIESLRVCVEAKDRENFNEIAEYVIQADIDWTKAGWNTVKHLIDRN